MRNLFYKRLMISTVVATMLFGSVITANAAQEDLFDAQYYAETYPDIAAAVGSDEDALLQHYFNYGITEGRSASAYFNALAYKTVNADLAAAFGDDWDAYADHYIQSGIAEGRYAGGERAITDAEYAAAAEKLAEGADTDASEEAQTVVSETETAEAVNGLYVVKNIDEYEVPIYRLGGNSESVWLPERFDDRSLEERLVEYGVSLDDIDFVTRTDFADGLIDNDGNGIDDRDPINGMGFIDLNHNGIDDRQKIINGGHMTQICSLGAGWQMIDITMTTESNTDVEKNDAIGEGESYLCPHNVVCSTANPYKGFYVKKIAFLPSFYTDIKTVYLDVLCPICNSNAYECKNIVDKLNEIDEDAVSETVFGYKVGDTTNAYDYGNGKSVVLTYIGEDKWVRDSDGEILPAGIKYGSGNTFDEIYSTREIHWGYVGY